MSTVEKLFYENKFDEIKKKITTKTPEKILEEILYISCKLNKTEIVIESLDVLSKKTGKSKNNIIDSLYLLNISCSNVQKYGNGYRHYSTSFIDKKLVEYLVNCGANTSVQLANKQINNTSLEETNCFKNACAVGDLDFIKFMVKHNFPVENDYTGYGENYLHYAAENITNNRINIFKYCLSLQLEPLEKAIGDILSRACYENDYEITDALITYGISMSKPTHDDKNFQYPIHYAITSNANSNFLDLLIKNGADINCKNYEVITPLMCACNLFQDEATSLKIVKMLFNYGANINDCDKNGMSALSYACGRAYKSVIEFLLEKNANVNQQDKQYTDKLVNTPLSHLCYELKYTRGNFKFFIDVVQLLLRFGATVTDRVKEICYTYKIKHIPKILGIDSIDDLVNQKKYNDVFEYYNIVAEQHVELDKPCVVCNNSACIISNCKHEYCFDCYIKYYYPKNTSKKCNFCNKRISKTIKFHQE